MKSSAEPFDLIVPDESVKDGLSSELRKMQAIERDMSLEKLTRPAKRFEAVLELAELRLTQAKLEEAKRFFEMALEMRPDDLRANEGLAMVHYHQGDFKSTKDIFERLMRLYPLSERLQKSLDKVRSKLSSVAQAGVSVHEDNRGITDILTSLELYFPSFTYPKLSARYRLEGWSLEESSKKINSRLLSATVEYILNHRNRIGATFAPETYDRDNTVNNYSLQGVTGSGNLHLSTQIGRMSFKENLASAKTCMHEDYTTIMLFGHLHERSRVIQSFSTATVSDGNIRKIFSSEVLYFMHRRGIPLFSMNLKLSFSGYEKQMDPAGNPLIYWSPSDYRSAQMTFSWERRVGSRWWWGIDTGFTANSFRDIGTETHYEHGVGFLLHLSYKFESGRIYAEYGNNIRDYYRERKLGAFCSVDF